MKSHKKIVRSVISVIALGFVLAALGASNSFGQGPLKEVLDRLDGNYKSLSSFRSHVTRVDYTDQTGTVDTVEGTTTYLPKSAQTKNKMYFRIDWVKPQESIVVIGDSYQLYRAGTNSVIEGNTSKAKNKDVAGGALAFIGMSKAQIQANYSVQYVGQEALKDATQTWHILLTPKAASSYKTAELWVDVNGMPRQALITMNGGDTTTVLLTKIEKNASINGSEFKLNLPANVARVKS